MVGPETIVVKDKSPAEIRLRRRAVNAAVFSDIGRRVFPRFAPTIAHYYNIVLNNELNPSINGERWLVSRLQAPEVLLDVGFHRGEWTQECIQRFPRAHVYGFDPWPRARAFFQSGKFGGNVELFELAFSNREGRFRFYDYDSGFNSLAQRNGDAIPLVGSYDVEVTTLDSWCEHHKIDRIDFLKIDVEGYDLPVLEGAHRLLKAQAIDAFCFEYGDGWIATRRLLGEADHYVKELEYSLFKLFPHFLAPLRYTLSHERFEGAMFVGLSPSALDRRAFPIRLVSGV
jgi:FkbM family methyltransferase